MGLLDIFFRLQFGTCTVSAKLTKTSAKCPSLIIWSKGVIHQLAEQHHSLCLVANFHSTAQTCRNVLEINLKFLSAWGKKGGEKNLARFLLWFFLITRPQNCPFLCISVFASLIGKGGSTVQHSNFRMRDSVHSLRYCTSSLYSMVKMGMLKPLSAPCRTKTLWAHALGEGWGVACSLYVVLKILTCR